MREGEPVQNGVSCRANSVARFDLSSPCIFWVLRCVGFSSLLGPLATESERETQVRLCLSAASHLPESRGKDLRHHGTKNTVHVGLVSGKSICMRTSDDMKHVFSF
jgi:hypothetical protein